MGRGRTEFTCVPLFCWWSRLIGLLTYTQPHHIAVAGLGKAWNQRHMLIAQLPGMKGKAKAYRHRISPHR